MGDFDHDGDFDEFNDFDIAAGLYFWLQHNWTSQSCPLYKAFCILTAPGMYRRGGGSQLFEDIGEIELLVYDALTLDNYGMALKRVLDYEPTE